MYFKTTYEDKFDDLWMHLKAKYPDKLFDLDGIGKQLDMSEFSRNFFSAKVTSDASIDANANVDDMSVIAYSTELPKPFKKINSYYVLWKELKRLYGHEAANNIIEMQVTGDIYIHDVHGIGAGMPYCFNYSTYDLMLKGLPMVKKVKSHPPKYLYAFKSQVEQFTVIASNSTLGATGLADLLVVMSYYVKNILNNKSDAHFNFKSEEDCWAYVKENLVSMVYTINQPMRANQCVTEDTEVLTPTGFKSYDKLMVGDDIYTWRNGCLNIQKVKRVNIHEYDGVIHEYKGRDVIQAVTPNHRVLYKRNNSCEYMLSPSEELISFKTPLTIPVAMQENDRDDYNISDEMLDLCVLVLTDGNIKTSEGKTPRISIFKSDRRWGREFIAKTIECLGKKYTTIERESGFGKQYGTLEYSICAEDSKDIVALLNGTKKELPDWMFKLSKRQAGRVIDLWSKMDGHTSEKEYGRQKLQCDNYNIADSLQHICFLACRGSKITERVIGNNKTATIYVIPYSENRKDKTAKNKLTYHYKGKVWCPTTDDGVVVFRKDGKLFVSGNSPFTNVSVYDKYFLEQMCEDYIFPDGSSPDIEIIQQLQELFLNIMNEELSRTSLTFPVTTACLSIDKDKNIQDMPFLQMVSDKNLEFGFINIYCGDSSTISSCCRLRSDGVNEYFNSFGSGSTKIGSLGVCSINFPRLAIKYPNREDFFVELRKMVEVSARINNAKRKVIDRRIANGNEPLYTYGFMELSKQYSTTGVNGFNECIELLGEDILTADGQKLAIEILEVINSENDKHQKKYKAPHNCEQVPGENMSIKMADKDRLLKYQDRFEIYSNQFIPLVTNADMIDRIKLQGLFDGHFSGGAICHLNVDTGIENSMSMANLIKVAAKQGVVYFAINYVLSECAKGHMTVSNDNVCAVCGGEIENKYTRVVGFLTNVKNWHKKRREEDFPNRQFYKGIL